MKKQLKKTIYLLSTLAFLQTFAGCDNAAENTDTKNSTENTTFTVGSTVSVSGLDYTVVSNTLDTAAGGQPERGIVTDAAVASLASVKRAAKFAEEMFGPNILLLRNAGKINIPQGEKEKYIKAYNAVVPKIIPPGFSEMDFFACNAVSDSKLLDYIDTYLVLNKKDLRKIAGYMDLRWDTSYGTIIYTDSDGNETTLSKLLEDFNPLLIRKITAPVYKTYTPEKYFTSRIVMNENGNVLQEQHPVCGYYYDIKNEAKPAALTKTDWNDSGEWTRKTICLCPILGSENSDSGLRITIRKNTRGYYYFFEGRKVTDEEKTEGKRPSTAPEYFIFDENGKFESENVQLEDLKQLVYSADVTKYDDSGYPYTAEIRSIPVSFVLNDDGSADFGQSVYDWAKKWRDIIVENNTGVTPYGD